MNWHKRFIQQAAWTRDLRNYLFEQTHLDESQRVLEIGCGTGAILREMDTSATVHGVDIEPAHVKQAKVHAPASPLTCADALKLPYAPQSFDVTYCHFLLLWLPNPIRALREIIRVTRPNGHILALAEPDYSRRVDKPAPLAELGQWQTEALRQQGANPNMGGKLAELFRQAGIQIVETGAISGHERVTSTPREREMEWAVLEADLAGNVAETDIQKMKKLDEQSWQRGERVLYVPTHYAWGISPT